jgi:hypothetical protein
VIGKFALTFFRMETIWFWGLQEAQLLALETLAFSIIWALWGRNARVAFKSE